MLQPILYAEQWWQKQRFLALFMIGAGVVASGFLFFQLHKITSQTVIWLLYIPTGLLFIGVLLYYRKRHHLQVRDEGLHVSNLFSSVTIGYELIRGVRVQPLNLHYQDRRKRLVTSMVRPLLDKPAIYVKLKADPEQAAYIAKKLGSRLFFDDTIVLPVPDPDAAAWEIGSRLPERIGVNQGGGRRKKRRR